MDYSLKFLGASVTSINMSMGNTVDATQVELNLVEDRANGDSFTTGTIMHPYEISYGDITIRGLLQRYNKSMSPQGSPVYNVRLVSPSQILDAASIVLSDYNSSISGVPNIMNLFGYWENTLGFGGSLVNPLGMVWEADHYTVTYVSGVEESRINNGKYGIKPGIEQLQTGINPFYGNAIGYRGHTYKFDFSQIPTGIDPNWRYNGANGSANLREIIETVCADNGYDWVTELTEINGNGPHTITIKTIDRKTPRIDGLIEAYANSKSGYASLQVGNESNFDQTNLFIVGANKQELWGQADQTLIRPFWGFDADGLAIEGAGNGLAYNVNLNCSHISSLIGSNSYNITAAEMRMAMISQDMWAAFIMLNKPVLSYALGIASSKSVTDDHIAGEPIAGGPVGGFNFPHDFINQNPVFVQYFRDANFNNNWNTNAQLLYQFVLNSMHEYYGRRFLVKTPYNISFKIEPDTGRIIYDWEPIETAFFDGTDPIGLSSLYHDSFQDNDYKFYPILKFNPIQQIDVTSAKNPNLIVQNNDVYVRGKMMSDVGVFYIGGFSYIAVELENPILYYPEDGLGGINSIASGLGLPINNMPWARNITDSSLKIYPVASEPVAVAFPVHSNISTYGPWFTNGPSGITIYEKMDGLAPWNYGGSYYMNLAASGYLQDFVRLSQVEENGSITYPGLPDRNIGDEILTSGSIITDINIDISTNGVTTTYLLKNHTQRPGSFGKHRADRMAILGKNMQEMGKNLLRSHRNTNNQLALYGGNINGRYSWDERKSDLIKQQTPHGVLVSNSTKIVNRVTNVITSQTFSESVKNIARPSGDIEYYNIAASSLDAILQPFSANPYHTGILPKFGMGYLGSIVCKDNVYAWTRKHKPAAHLSRYHSEDSSPSIEWYIAETGNAGLGKTIGYDQDGYIGVHSRKYDPASPTARSFSLAGPVDISAWGYDIWGRPIPNADWNPSTLIGPGAITGSVNDRIETMPLYAHHNPQSGSYTDFYPGYNKNSNLWIEGPLNAKYDVVKGVWTFPNKVKGIIREPIGPYSKGILDLKYGLRVESSQVSWNDRIDFPLTVRNIWTATTLPSGHFATAYWDDWEHEWCIDQVECDAVGVAEEIDVEI